MGRELDHDEPKNTTAQPIATPEPQDTEYEREDRGLLDAEIWKARWYE